jgi:hypothetical protein
MAEEEEDGQYNNSLKDYYNDHLSLPQGIRDVLRHLFTAHQWPVGSRNTKPSKRLHCCEEADMLRDLLTLYDIFPANETFAEVCVGPH